MECLNEKYGLDYYSSLESDSDFELEHKYETLLWTLYQETSFGMTFQVCHEHLISI